MLFPYTYVPHQMEKMHEIIEYIFYEVWCKASSVQYDIALFEGMPELYTIMDDLYKKDMAEQLRDGAGKDFYTAVNSIFSHFKELSEADLDSLWCAFEANNDIEWACSDLNCPSSVYSQISLQNNRLLFEIEKFYKNLYSSGFWTLKIVKETIGATLGDYYNSFVQINEKGVCPFCGLMPMDNEHDPTREAFDHYLPKSKYPFNSVNLKNLPPACHKCNSGNKSTLDPIMKGHQRRKAFYPFSRKSPDTELTITVVNKEWDELTAEDLAIEITSEAYPDEVETWKELFRIKERYVARCCGYNGYKVWLNRIFEERKNYGISTSQMLAGELGSARNNPFSEVNFLKIAFLEACDQAGLFENEVDAEPTVEGAA